MRCRTVVLGRGAKANQSWADSEHEVAMKVRTVVVAMRKNPQCQMIKGPRRKELDLRSLVNCKVSLSPSELTPGQQSGCFFVFGPPLLRNVEEM